MPLAYSIDPDRPLVTITGDYGDAAAWNDLLQAIGADPSYRRGSDFIRDLRGSEHPVTPETVRDIIAVVRLFWRRLGARRAAIVTRPMVDAPAVVAHALAQDQDMPLRAFSAYDDALAWLGEGREDPPA
jgi:hypothetical protein